MYRISQGLSTAGLLLVAVGTFLPWLRSGGTELQSYQVGGLMDRLAHFDDAFAVAVLRAWPAVPLVSAVCIALFTLGWTRSAAVATVLLAGPVGTVVALLAWVKGNGAIGPVEVIWAGPITTFAGSILAVAGALGAPFAQRRPLTTEAGERP